jgi:hypothetical protein
MPDLLERAGSKIAMGSEEVFPAVVDQGYPYGSIGGSAAIAPSEVYFGVGVGYTAGGVALSHDWLRSALTRMNHLMTLPPGWDGDHAAPLDRDTVKVVWSLLQGLAPEVSTPPTVVPTVSGGLAVEWHTEEAELEIEFRPGGATSVYVQMADGSEFDGDLRASGQILGKALAALR